MEFSLSPQQIDLLAGAILALASWITLHLSREESN
jgi:hypothetical protein